MAAAPAGRGCFPERGPIENGYAFQLATLTCQPGEEGSFYADIDTLLPRGPTGITYNGNGFDLSVLRLGAMAAHAFELPGLANQAGDRRYGDQHCDLAEMFSGYGATPAVAPSGRRSRTPCTSCAGKGRTCSVKRRT